MNTKRDYYPAFVDSTIEKQRDDLLAMLERVTAVAACIYNNGKQSDCIAEARALIATIKGE